MIVPREQEVLALMGDACSIEPIADLLVALGYPDVAKELRAKFDRLDTYDDMQEFA